MEETSNPSRCPGDADMHAARKASNRKDWRDRALLNLVFAQMAHESASCSEHQREDGYQDHEADDGKDYGDSYLVGMHARSRYQR